MDAVTYNDCHLNKNNGSTRLLVCNLYLCAHIFLHRLHGIQFYLLFMCFLLSNSLRLLNKKEGNRIMPLVRQPAHMACMTVHSKPSWSLTYEPFVATPPAISLPYATGEKEMKFNRTATMWNLRAVAHVPAFVNAFPSVPMCFYAFVCFSIKKCFHFFQLQMKSKPHSCYLSWRGCAIGCSYGLRLYFSAVHRIRISMSVCVFLAMFATVRQNIHFEFPRNNLHLNPVTTCRTIGQWLCICSLFSVCFFFVHLF